MEKSKRLRSNSKLTTRCEHPNQPAKHHQWSNESMFGELKVVQEGNVSINHAATEHGIPKTTYKDYVSDLVDCLCPICTEK